MISSPLFLPKNRNDRRPSCSEEGTDPEIWFSDERNPDVSVDERKVQIRKAKSICFSCPLLSSCLEWSLDQKYNNRTVLHGIWGGLTRRERTIIYRRSKTLLNPEMEQDNGLEKLAS